MSTPDQDTLPDPPQSKLVWVPILAGITLLLAYAIYFGFVEKAPKGGPDSWGQFGDFLGGLLNPVVGTITIVLLVRTLQQQGKAVEYQRIELAEQRKELTLQREETAKSTLALSAQNKAIQMQSFEQTFFAWLQSYKAVVEQIQSSTGSATGQRALNLIASSFNGRSARPRENQTGGLHNPKPVLSYADAIREFLEYGNPEIIDRFEIALGHYHETYRANHSQLGPMFRTLFRMIEWVDHSPLSASERWHYVAIIRSQLSWAEMYFLAFNGCTPRGTSFATLINKYALLDNLEADTDGLAAAMRDAFVLSRPNHFPYTKAAFVSSAAKLELDFVEMKDIA